MGIVNLLPEFLEAMPICHVKELAGKSAAIDVSGWHFKHDWEQYIYNEVMRLREYEVTPILVLDGKSPEAKRDVILKRERMREKYKEEAKALREENKEEEAKKKELQATRRSPHFEDIIKKFCETYKVKYVHAPYEADAQIAFLMQEGIADFVITEDSDLMVFGCHHILYKYNGGVGKMFDQTVVTKHWKAPFDLACFRAVCILMGCDYLMGGLWGFGPVKAKEFYAQLTPNFDFNQMINLIDVEFDDEELVPKFKGAVNSFLHQLVYNPATGEIVPLSPYPEGTSASDYLLAGDPKIAKGYSYPPNDANPNPTGEAVSLIGTRPKIYAPILEKRFYCKDCVAYFSGYQKLLEHRRKEHPFTCTTCEKTFLHNWVLTQHIKIHSRERPYQCEMCEKAFKSKGDLTKHMMTHTGKKPHQCDLCAECFTLKGNLHRHMLTHTEEKPYQCDVCEKAFKSKDDLNKHMFFHTGEKPHQCVVCEKAFAKKSTLIIHMRAHTGEKPHQCDVCKKAYSTKSDLTRHMCKHTGVKRHKCDVCEQAFVSKSNLDLHILTHTGEKPHECDVCKQRFLRKSHLKRHMLTHSGDKPHKCDICDKAFALKSNLSNHMKTHTERKPADTALNKDSPKQETEN